MRNTLLLVVLAFAMACSSPPSKNSVANSNPNNTSTNNQTSNNGTFNNSSVPNSLWAANFDQACDWDSECTTVFEGDQCQCGGNACANAGIRTEELESWNSQADGLCPDGMEVCSAAPCPETIAVCASGSCAAQPAIYIDATDWDRTCSADDDCAIVHEGRICSDCVCGGTAVNVAELEKAEVLLEGVDCRPGPQTCECAAVDEAWCNQGTCEPGNNPECVGIDGNGFFSNCDTCGDNCDTIDTSSGSRNACGCETSADCPCGLSCGEYEIGPNIVVSGICVR